MAEPQSSSGKSGSNPMSQSVYMNGFAEDKPSNYWDWRPSATFMDYPPQDGSLDSKNKEHGRQPAAATPTHERSKSKRHTPATFPRTRYLGSGREKAEMEGLRQQLTFSDVEETSNENDLTEAAPSTSNRWAFRRNPKPASDVGELPHPGGGESAHLNIPVNDVLNRNQVVARLMQIREYIKQANSMISSIGESGIAGLQDEQVLKLGRLQEHLKEQERGYLILLERMLGEDPEGQGRNSQNSDVSFATSVAESTSLNVDARSDISEASTVGTYTTKTRPRIESSMGNYQSDSEITSEGDEGDDPVSVNSEVTGSFGLDTGELHEQYSSMLAKYDPVDDHERETQNEEPCENGLISSENNSQNDVNEQIEALAGLQQQHDLLKKMLQQQEELRNLQDRQSSLMKLQEQIDSRLAANETPTEATPSETSQQTEASKTVTEASSMTGREPPSETESEKYKEALQDLRRRTLRRMLNENRDQELQQLAAQSELSQREQDKAQQLSEEHQELRGKLLSLQQKKDDIGRLLQQLHALGADDVGSASSIDPQAEAEGSQRNAAGGSGDGSKREGASMGTEGLSKLQEVRHRLTELRDLVQEYQDTTGNVPNGNISYDEDVPASNLRKLDKSEPTGRQRGQHRHNQASTQTVGPPLINQSEDETQGTPSVTEEETENESEPSSVPAAWTQDPELHAKFRKLENAKQKLRELQELVSIVQETPEAAIGLPDDLAELAVSLTEEMSEVMEGHDEMEDKDEESGVAEIYSEMSEGEVPEQTREAYYEAKMRQQRRELEKLMEERGRLLKVQGQLKDLNQKLPPVDMINNFSQEQRRHNRRLGAAANPQVALTPNRDEVYAEMRRHKILQEELRQKKRELAALMARVKRNKMGNGDINDLEDNDLFRVSMRSADVTAAATWGGSSQMSDTEENNDAYPSDGVGAEEEEEDEEEESVAMTSDTYTIDRPSFNPDRPELPPNESDYDESLLAMHGIRFPRRAYGQPNPRQENLRPAEELVDDMSQYSEDYLRLQVQVDHLQAQLEDSMRLTQSLVKDQQTMMNMIYQNNMSGENTSGGRGDVQPSGCGGDDTAHYSEDYLRLQVQVHHLQAQLEDSMRLTQSLVKDQQTMMNMNCQNNMSGTNTAYQGPSPPSMPSHMSYGPGDDRRLAEMLYDYDLRLRHQQLQLNLNNAYNDLFKQQEALEEFYKQAEEVEHDNANANNSAYGRGEGPEEVYERDLYSPYGRPGYVSGRNYKTGLTPESRGNSFNLAPRFPPEFDRCQREMVPPAQETSAQSYLSQYKPYTREQQSSRYRHPYAAAASYHVPPNSSQRSLESNDMEPVLHPKLVAGAAASGRVETEKGGKEGLRQTREVHTSTRSPIGVGIPKLDINSLLKKTERNRLRQLERESTGDQPTKKQDAATNVSSSARAKAMSKMAARSKLTNADPNSPARLRPGLSSHVSGTAFLDAASMTSTMSYSSMPGELEQEGMNYVRPGTAMEKEASVKSQSEVPSEAGSEYSLFEALRESIYSEVASLISQNESRPHFLIELFRELQMLNTDYLRQRALYALQDLVSKTLTDESQSQNIDELTGTYLHWQTAAVSEHTPSESFFTSEEDEIKAQLYSQKPNLQPSESKGSLTGMEYDYMEKVQSASSLSTPNSVGDFGFASEELGNTVIHLDKALQRMREYERMKAEAEGSAGTTSSAAVSSKPEDTNATASDVTSNSSAQDIGSESSLSDLTYPRIDTRQLDLQIKSIMQEVIPYLKEHMDDVCSPQLLAYICRLVMNLARQRDDSREFVMFFNRQLGSILEDSLAKFSGRKMRECGEDLLVDISEILFNELAFFRLMQDLDTAGDKLRHEIEKEGKKDDAEGTEDDSKAEEEEGEDEGDDDDDESEMTGTETGQDDGVTDNTTTDEENEALAKTDDTIATVVEAGSKLVQEAMENVMAMASTFEAEELGKDRDDMFAAETMISENDEDSEPVNGVKIELSVSESKAVTYLGSEEDDNDRDDFSQNNEETETSLGMSSNIPTDAKESSEPKPTPPAPSLETPSAVDSNPASEKNGEEKLPNQDSLENKDVDRDSPDKNLVEGNSQEVKVSEEISVEGKEEHGDIPENEMTKGESLEDKSGEGNFPGSNVTGDKDTVELNQPRENITSPEDTTQGEEPALTPSQDDTSKGQGSPKTPGVVETHADLDEDPQSIKESPVNQVSKESGDSPRAQEESQNTARSPDRLKSQEEGGKEEVIGSDFKDANENEVTIDDLPPKLTSLSQMQIEARMEEEASMTDLSKAVLESMVSGEDQLAGDGETLPEPEGMPAENGVMSQELEPDVDPK